VSAHPSLTVRTLPGPLGAVEVDGFDAAAHVDDRAASDLLRDALCQHAVMCIRLPAPLTDDELRAIAGMIGPIKVPIGRTRDGGLLRYSEDNQVVDAGFVLTDELRAQLALSKRTSSTASSNSSSR
jgi:hypothetical protein